MSYEEDVSSQARGVSEDASTRTTDEPTTNQNRQPDQADKALDHPPEPPHRKCNWCGIRFHGKNCCESCTKKGHECRSCHRPMPSNFFNSDPNTCNACYRKHRKTRERLGNVPTTISYGPLDGRPNDDKHDLTVFLNNRPEEMVGDITTELTEKRGIKLYLTCNLSMSRHSVDGDLYISEPFIRTDIIRLLDVTVLQDSIDDAFSQLESALDHYNGTGSGRVMDAVIDVTINVAAYQPLSL